MMILDMLDGSKTYIIYLFHLLAPNTNRKRKRTLINYKQEHSKNMLLPISSSLYPPLQMDPVCSNSNAIYLSRSSNLLQGIICRDASQIKTQLHLRDGLSICELAFWRAKASTVYCPPLLAGDNKKEPFRSIICTQITAPKSWTRYANGAAAHYDSSNVHARGEEALPSAGALSEVSYVMIRERAFGGINALFM